jgi:GH24 family phage-related lysozyme (muramidase)
MAQPNSKRVRTVVGALAVSAAAFTTWQAREGFTDHAVIPVKGDVPTIGHGSTHYENGAPVKMGDTITRKRADQLARNLMSKDEQAFKASLPPSTMLTQDEYDVYIDFVGEYGIGTWNLSSMRRDVIAGRYAQACADLKKYRFVAGYDCSTPGNHRCYGVWTRQLARYNQCMGFK